MKTPDRATRDCRLLLFLPTLLATSCGIFGLSTEERQRLALYQQNAANYYEGRRFPQALTEVEKGLEISPADYKLHSIAGWCHLLSAEGNPQRLAQAEQLFDRLNSMRSTSDHDAHALLGYAICKKRLGVLHQDRAKRLRSEAASPDLAEESKAIRIARATEHENMFRSYFRDSVRVYEQLIDREESVRIAHKHIMEIRVLEGDYQGAVEQGNLCLERIDPEKRYLNRIIAETMSVDYEREKRVELQRIIDQENRVRSALAEMHFRREKFQASVEQLNLLLSADPSRANDYYNRARALEAMGEKNRAYQDFEKFLMTTNLPMGDERVRRAFGFNKQHQGRS